MNPILLRNDGPIENDIKPYCLDGKDIKTALEDIKNSLLSYYRTRSYSSNNSSFLFYLEVISYH